MRRLNRRTAVRLLGAACLPCGWSRSTTAALAGENDGWITLSSADFSAWKSRHDWDWVGAVELDPKHPRRLISKPGTGVMTNARRDRTPNLITKRSYGDLEVSLEFNIPRGSNSGIKFEGLYEIQILDSYGVEHPKGTDCGGIYPRAQLLPKYHYLDAGHPPLANACKAPGE